MAASASRAHSPRESGRRSSRPARASTSARATTSRLPRFCADSRPDQTHRRIVSAVRPLSAAAALTSSSSPEDGFTPIFYYAMAAPWSRSSPGGIRGNTYETSVALELTYSSRQAVRPRRYYSACARRRRVSLDSSQLMSEHKGELGAALTQLVAALEQVGLDALQPRDRDLLERALVAARAALHRATSRNEPFPQED